MIIGFDVLPQTWRHLLTGVTSACKYGGRNRIGHMRLCILCIFLISLNLIEVCISNIRKSYVRMHKLLLLCIHVCTYIYYSILMPQRYSQCCLVMCAHRYTYVCTFTHRPLGRSCSTASMWISVHTLNCSWVTHIHALGEMQWERCDFCTPS